MSYIWVYLLIRIYKGKTIEITETVSDTSSFSNNQPVYPFDDTKFVIAYGFFLQASDYDCLFESSFVSLYQYEAYRDENSELLEELKYYDIEVCNNTHFSDEDFNNIPILNRMRWISSNFSISGSNYSK